MVKPSDVDLPIIFPNQTLFRSGVHNPKTNNNFNFNKNMVENSVKNTKWSALNKRLYLKHSGAFDVSKWKGKVENIRAENGDVIGDVELWDGEEGISIAYGKKPVAISADIEYSPDTNVMFFKGFAIENDPGIKDTKMFLSESVRDELSGMYHASFSSELNTDNVGINTSQINPITNQTQSAERRLEMKTVNMEGQNETPVNANVQTPQVPTQPVINVNNTGADVELVRKLSEKIDALEAQGKQLSAQLEQKNTQPVATQGTVADTQLKNVSASDNLDDLVNKIAEKIKPVITQKPITMNEFDGQPGVLTGDGKTIDRLAGFFEKKNE